MPLDEDVRVARHVLGGSKFRRAPREREATCYSPVSPCQERLARAKEPSPAGHQGQVNDDAELPRHQRSGGRGGS